MPLNDSDLARLKWRLDKTRNRRPEDVFVIQNGGRIFFVAMEYRQSLRDELWSWSWDVSEAIPGGSRTWSSHDGWEAAQTRSDALSQAAVFIAREIIGDPDTGPDFPPGPENGATSP